MNGGDWADVFTVVAGLAAVATLAWGVWIYFRPAPRSEPRFVVSLSPIDVPLDSPPHAEFRVSGLLETDAPETFTLSKKAELAGQAIDRSRLATGMIGGYRFDLAATDLPEGRTFAAGKPLRFGLRVKSSGIYADPAARRFIDDGTGFGTVTFRMSVERGHDTWPVAASTTARFRISEVSP